MHGTVEETPETAESMPLGVFSWCVRRMSKPTMFLELAVSKEGTIAGTYSNTTSDSAQPVEGRVDQESQRAAWWIGSNQNNILETGIYNLTKEETPAMATLEPSKHRRGYSYGWKIQRKSRLTLRTG